MGWHAYRCLSLCTHTSVLVSVFLWTFSVVAGVLWLYIITAGSSTPTLIRWICKAQQKQKINTIIKKHDDITLKYWSRFRASDPLKSTETFAKMQSEVQVKLEVQHMSTPTGIIILVCTALQYWPPLLCIIVSDIVDEYFGLKYTPKFLAVYCCSLSKSKRFGIK